jgi:hypothetical protein
MAVEQWKIGDVTITKIEEVAFWAPMQFLDATLAAWAHEEVEAMTWLDPTWTNVEAGTANGSVNSLLVQTPTKKLVVDTGIGNGRVRKNESCKGLLTDFLERFSEVWDPTEVDGVVCTTCTRTMSGGTPVSSAARGRPPSPTPCTTSYGRSLSFWQEYAKADGAGSSYSDWPRRSGR